MGCNESKHDTVATGNTILRRKQSDNVKSTKDIETVKENPTAENNIDHEHHANDAIGQENEVAPTLVEERNIDDPKKESKGEDQEAVNGGDNDDHEGLISRDSPNHFFSSRKDGEETILGNNIDGIISEGRSGKSEYNTPRHEHDDNVKADRVEAVVENDNKDDHDQDQSKPEEKNENPGNVQEDAKLKEEELLMAAAETEVPSPVEQEKSTTPTDEGKQHVADSPTEELKTV